VPYYVKIDVEGFEINVIRGMDKVPAFISFETNLPEFMEETIECVRQIINRSPSARFNYSINDKLELTDWISAIELEKMIRNEGLRYMEIISKNTH
jgi:hypothetical protein